jgi:hypothetical protein
MRGFAACSQRATNFSAVLDHLTADLGVSSVIRFGGGRSGSEPVTELLPLSRAIHCGPFYSRPQNPDYELYHQIAQDSSEAPYVYITDGVQSDIGGTNQSPSIQALRQWIANGHGLAILAFRSAFSGPAWSEQMQKMQGTITVESRPFYAFVFAQSDADIDAILGRLSPQTTGSTVLIRFSPNAVRCAVHLHHGIPQLLKKSVPPWAMTRHDALKRNAVLADYDCRIDNSYPFASITPTLSTTYTERTDRPFPPVGEPPPGTSLSKGSMTADGEGSVIEIRADLPKSTSARYGLYEMRFEPAPGALKSTIEALSTDSDANPDAFDRTYRFSWLIDQLGRTHLSTVPWVPFALTVKYN